MSKLYKPPYRTIYWTYLLQRLNDGSWVELNREYKPLGVHPDGWINYEKYPFKTKIASIPPELRVKLSFNGDGSGDKLYLYNDGCIPTDSRTNQAAYDRKINIIEDLKMGAGSSPT